ncbi:S-phase kinase-associated protein 2 [Onthophagus taurus]|uniref:S-phase kinase-associated protein 2 n=1 Tax=Onthophagus taurus TaxID=166361 RepID=UPI000C2024CB|nr:S-phase kinase-associated protein 2 [Onthophagus taurus]
MTTKSVLQPIDINSPNMERSPARKKARYDSPAKERWSLARKSVPAYDDLNGVELLCDSDSEQSEVTADEVLSNLNSYFGNRLSDLPVEKYSSEPECSHGSDEKEYCVPLNSKSESIINYFEDISDEVMLHIFHFLPKRFLSTAALVCKRWHRLSEDESLWARMDLGSKQLQAGAMGHIMSRQALVLRLAQAEISHPPILDGCYAYPEDFRARLLYLDLSMAHVAPESLVEIFKRCCRLKKVSLEHVRINGDVLDALGYSKDIEILNLAMVEGIKEHGMRSLLENCRKLRELNVAWTYLDAATLMVLCSALPENLDRLNLSGCRKTLTDDNIRRLTSRCKKLRELDLSDCTGLTGETILHILQLKGLNFLALSRCYQIPYKSLVYLKQIKSLVYLDVHAGYMDTSELRYIQDNLGPSVLLNKFKFSSIARPTVGPRRSSIWNMRVRD